jgi:transcriptional regulator with XRE-family HTH domain
MKQIKNNQLLDAMRTVLRDLRTGNGLTQDAVITDIFDRNGNTINLARIETGEGNISPSTLFLLCEYYRMPLSKFFQKVEEVDKKLLIRDKK